MKLNSRDWQRIAETVIDLPRASVETISSHLSLDPDEVADTLADPIFQDLLDMHRKGRFSLWAGIIAQDQIELSKIISRLGYDAVLRLKALIYSEDEKVAGAAIRTALEYNAELERPIVRHEITTRFTAEELDKAREVVKKLKLPQLPAPPDGPPN
jgi:hypothetical protein